MERSQGPPPGVQRQNEEYTKIDNRPQICVFDMPIMDSTKNSKLKSTRPPLALRKHGHTPLMTASSMIVRQSNQEFQSFQKQFQMSNNSNDSSSAQHMLMMIKSPKNSNNIPQIANEGQSQGKENLPAKANLIQNGMTLGMHRKRLMSANRMGSHRNILNGQQQTHLSQGLANNRSISNSSIIPNAQKMAVSIPPVVHDNSFIENQARENSAQILENIIQTKLSFKNIMQPLKASHLMPQANAPHQSRQHTAFDSYKQIATRSTTMKNSLSGMGIRKQSSTPFHQEPPSQQQEDEQISLKIKIRPQSGRPMRNNTQVVQQAPIVHKTLAKYESQTFNTLCSVPAPAITSKSWIIYDLREDVVFQSKKDSVKRQVASLTKMMTFYTVMKLMDKFRLQPPSTIITISKTASCMNGTSANLRDGDQLSVAELFYGLLLPSGNDAAYALAEYFGGLLQSTQVHKNGIPDLSQLSPTKLFIKEMNRYAQRLKMLSTQFDSPHGLANRHNFSTARDILTLSIACMKIARFREIVGAKTHKAISLSASKTVYSWETTNKLIGKKEHWVGCKTGVTDPAGPCFSGFYENKNSGERFCVVVLKCKTMEQRWQEVPKMVKWAIKTKRFIAAQQQTQVSQAPEELMVETCTPSTEISQIQQINNEQQ